MSAEVRPDPTLELAEAEAVHEEASAVLEGSRSHLEKLGADKATLEADVDRLAAERKTALEVGADPVEIVREMRAATEKLEEVVSNESVVREIADRRQDEVRSARAVLESARRETYRRAAREVADELLGALTRAEGLFARVDALEADDAHSRNVSRSLPGGSPDPSPVSSTFRWKGPYETARTAVRDFLRSAGEAEARRA